jgi:glycerol-3-phosphate O-acyltransferase/dihydroxyacetone phosphate acyltransferase
MYRRGVEERARQSDPPTRVYRALRAVARVALGVFYRRIQVTGLEHLDGHAPTILASTHPNSIVDPLVVGIFEDRQVTFCARDGLFRVPGFGMLLRAIGAVPIRRRMDHGGEASLGGPRALGGGEAQNQAQAQEKANDDAFAECRAVLARGGVISIFPEGKTHSRLRVEPLKTGVARMALDAAEHGVHIVPVGLNYLVREAFRSDVHVAFGPPLELSKLRAQWAEDPQLADDPRAQVRALTEALGDSLRALAVHVEHQEDERLIAQVTAIMVELRQDEGLEDESPADRTALVRRVIDAYRWLGEREPVRCARLRERVSHYVEARRRLGLAATTSLQKPGERSTVDKLLGREDRSLFGPVGLVIGAPIAVYGFAVAFVPWAILQLVLRLGRPSRYRIALTKLLGGSSLFLGWFALLTWLLFEATGPVPAIVFAASLIPAVLFTHRYVIDLRLHRYGVRAGVRRLLHGRQLVRLAAERRRLVRDLGRVRAAYLATHPTT